MKKWILAERGNTFLSLSPLRPPWEHLGGPGLPDAPQMSSRWLPDASRWHPDDSPQPSDGSQFPPYLRCVADALAAAACKKKPDVFFEVSKMSVKKVVRRCQNRVQKRCKS